MPGRPPVQRQRLHRRLRDLLAEGVWAPGAILPAERDLAQRLGASRSALRQVLAACADLERLPQRGWRRRPMATVAVGPVLHLRSIEGPSDQALGRGLGETLEPLGGTVINLRHPRPRDDDGGPGAEVRTRLVEVRSLVAFTEYGLPPAWVEACRAAGVAPVCVGANQQLGYDAVCADFAAMSRDLVRAIHGKGHRHIAFCGVRRLHRENPAFRARVTGYELAMADLGLHREVAYFADDFERHHGVESEVARWLEQCDAQGRRPTCLYVSGSRMVARMATVLHRLGLRVPHDLSLAGFGVSPDVLHGERRLFDRFLHVDEPWTAIGRAIGARLIARAHGVIDPVVTLVPSAVADGDSVVTLKESP